MKIRCIAVDDEYLALDVIRNYVQKIPFLELLQTFDSAISAIAFLKEQPVDLIFLDIQMKELSGMQFLKALKDPPMVIFTTAYDHYAVESYELDVLDYLLKPISFDRFVKAIDKTSDRLRTGPPHAAGTPASDRDFLFIKTGSSLERVSYDDILFIKGERDYLKIFTLQKSLMVLLKFQYFEDKLPKNLFCRVHKSYLVALNKIRKIDGNVLWIRDNRIPVGSTYRAHFFQKVLKG